MAKGPREATWGRTERSKGSLSHCHFSPATTVSAQFEVAARYGSKRAFTARSLPGYQVAAAAFGSIGFGAAEGLPLMRMQPGLC